MERIIDGLKFEGKRSETSWRAKVWEQNGFTEKVLFRPIVWTEVDNHLYSREGSGFQGQPTDDDLKRWAAWDKADADKRAAASVKASARRSKTKCRRIIKVERFDQMLTLTTRENIRDRDRFYRYFKEFVRRMKVALGDFRYCASFEPQDRGAWHAHITTHKLPTVGRYRGQKVNMFELGTRIWRSVIGSAFVGPLRLGEARPAIANGLCFIGGRSKNGLPARVFKQSISAMADYCSKYILKHAERCPEHKSRYLSSKGIGVHEPLVIEFENMELADAISLLFELRAGERLHSHYLGYDCGLWGMATEKILFAR